MYLILGSLPRGQYGDLKRVWAQCLHCGKPQVIKADSLRRSERDGRSRCAHCPPAHSPRMRRIWRKMLSRATDPKAKDFPRYGGVGRGVADAWLSFENFCADMAGSYQDDLTLERIDNSKGYSKENCRWATHMEQQRNKLNNRFLTYQGQKLHLAELVRITGLSKIVLTYRLAKGMTAEEAVQDARNSPYGRSTDPRCIRNRKGRRCST